MPADVQVTKVAPVGGTNGPLSPRPGQSALAATEKKFIHRWVSAEHRQCWYCSPRGRLLSFAGAKVGVGFTRARRRKSKKRKKKRARDHADRKRPRKSRPHAQSRPRICFHHYAYLDFITRKDTIVEKKMSARSQLIRASCKSGFLLSHGPHDRVHAASSRRQAAPRRVPCAMTRPRLPRGVRP